MPVPEFEAPGISAVGEGLAQGGGGFLAGLGKGLAGPRRDRGHVWLAFRTQEEIVRDKRPTICQECRDHASMVPVDATPQFVNNRG